MGATEHLDAAARYIAQGEDYYRRAADEIVAALREEPTLSQREIGRRLGRHESWVRDLVRWRTNAGDHPQATPFAGQYDDRMERAARNAVRERPEVIADELAKASPDVQRRVAEALPLSPGRVVEALKDPETRSRVLGDPGGIAVTLAMGRELTAREPREREESLPSPPAFASAFWRAVSAVHAAWEELDRVGVQGLDADPETRLAAERLTNQAADVGRAVADHVVENIEEV